VTAPVPLGGAGRSTCAGPCDGDRPYPEYGKAFWRPRWRTPGVVHIRHRIGITEECEIAQSGTICRADSRRTRWRKPVRGSTRRKVWSAGCTRRARSTGLAPGRVAQARSDQATLAIEEAQLLDGIALQVRTRRNAVRDAGEVVRAIADTVGQAERLLALADAKRGVEYGVKTKLEGTTPIFNLNQRGSPRAGRADYLVADLTSGTRWTLGEEWTASNHTVKDVFPPRRPAGGSAKFWRPAGLASSVARGQRPPAGSF